MGAPGPEQRKEPRYQVTYHTYLASGRRLSYTPSVERVVGLKYAKRSLLVLQNFAIFRLRHAHVRKDTRLSTAFPYCKRRKAGRGLGMRLYYMCVTLYYAMPQELLHCNLVAFPDSRLLCVEKKAIVNFVAWYVFSHEQRLG